MRFPTKAVGALKAAVKRRRDDAMNDRRAPF
jgi:hypothetical protein